MVQNLTESLARTPWILWLSIACLGFVAEWIERGGWLGRLGVALAAGALVALAWPAGWWAQWLACVVVAVGVFVVRRRRAPRAEKP